MTLVAINKESNVNTPFDVDQIRADFPVLNQKISGHQLAYLDNGASTQKPSQVIEVIKELSLIHI